jgi:hypothetical protein
MKPTHKEMRALRHHRVRERRKRGEVLVTIVVTPEMMDKLGIERGEDKLLIEEAILRLIDAQQNSPA